MKVCTFASLPIAICLYITGCQLYMLPLYVGYLIFIISVVYFMICGLYFVDAVKKEN